MLTLWDGRNTLWQVVSVLLPSSTLKTVGAQYFSQIGMLGPQYVGRHYLHLPIFTNICITFHVKSASWRKISLALSSSAESWVPGVSPQAKSILRARDCLQMAATKMISVAGLKAQRGLVGPESFKVKAVHLVSVLIDHRHIILPVQGLICPLNQHLLSTAAVVCWGWGGGGQRRTATA